MKKKTKVISAITVTTLILAGGGATALVLLKPWENKGDIVLEGNSFTFNQDTRRSDLTTKYATPMTCPEGNEDEWSTFLLPMMISSNYFNKNVFRNDFNYSVLCAWEKLNENMLNLTNFEGKASYGKTSVIGNCIYIEKVDIVISFPPINMPDENIFNFNKIHVGWGGVVIGNSPAGVKWDKGLDDEGSYIIGIYSLGHDNGAIIAGLYSDDASVAPMWHELSGLQSYDFIISSYYLSTISFI